MSTTASIKDRLFAVVQLCLPTRWLSWCMYKLTRIEASGFKNAFIRIFMRSFNISLDEAQLQKVESFAHFNAFFTRALKADARPMASDLRALVSPVDGTISQLGEIHQGRIFQAKGHEYSAEELLGGDSEIAMSFANGRFCTIYLAPHNYHRIHMPVAGTLREWIYVPGRLFSVNQATARAMPNLFARNERVVAIFDTEIGPLAMVLVGALFVGSMETVWAGQISPPHERGGISHYQPLEPVKLGRGAEMGRFNMGSTVILLAGPQAVAWQASLRHSSMVRVGQEIGKMNA